MFPIWLQLLPPTAPEMAQDVVVLWVRTELAAALAVKGEPMLTKDNGAFGMRWEATSAWLPLLPAAIREEWIKAEPLAEALLSLDEPWRSRFLFLVANLATNWAWGGQRPTWEEVTAWLGGDLGLYQYIGLLLDVWGRPRR